MRVILNVALLMLSLCGLSLAATDGFCHWDQVSPVCLNVTTTAVPGEYKFTVTSAAGGWAGVGFGCPSMLDCQVHIGWLAPDGKVRAVRRKTQPSSLTAEQIDEGEEETAYEAPEHDPALQKGFQYKGSKLSGKFKFSYEWTQKMELNQAEDVFVLAAAIDMSSVSVPLNAAATSFGYHDHLNSQFRHPFALNLKKAEAAAPPPPQPPAPGPTNQPNPGSNNYPGTEKRPEKPLGTKPGTGDDHQPGGIADRTGGLTKRSHRKAV